MKLMKKLMVVFVALFMVISMASKVDAAETYTITIDNAVKDETYTAYKIFDVTYSGTPESVGEVPAAPAPDNTNQHTAYSYSIVEGSGWWEAVTHDGAIQEDGQISANGLKFTPTTQKVDGHVVYNVEKADTFDPAVFAKFLNDNAEGKTGTSATASGTTVTIDVSSTGAGYYFVDTTLGSLCSLDTTEPTATIREKNTITVPDKQQGTEAGTYSDAQLDVNIGDTVYYDSKIIVGKGANYEIKGTDTLSAGLTLNHGEGEITVKVGSTAVDAENYTLTANDSGFTIVFTSEYISTLEENDEIEIEYSAVVNENAVIRGDNPNTWKIEYSQQHEDDSTIVKTYDAQVKKVDATTKEFLAGAGFKLYDAATGGNQITVAKDDTGYYVNAEVDEEIMIESADGANIRGLAPGTYYLEETTVPEGYNKLPARKEFTVTKDATAAVEIIVENESGVELPSTGGIGTTIFHVVGAALVLGAGVILIAKKRVNG